MMPTSDSDTSSPRDPLRHAVSCSCAVQQQWAAQVSDKLCEVLTVDLTTRVDNIGIAKMRSDRDQKTSADIDAHVSTRLGSRR